VLAQFSREWLQLYPQARVLAASSEDIAGDKRRLFLGRAATNDWDGVIMTRSAFERLPVSIESEVAYREQRLGELREQLQRAQGGSGLTVKRLEKAVARDAEQLKRLRDATKDRSVSFEQTGFDYVIVDFTSRRFRVRLVRSRGCGAGWRTQGQGLRAEASTSFARENSRASARGAGLLSEWSGVGVTLGG
jgi:N12 class adenine-specific DNA methylase